MSARLEAAVAELVAALREELAAAAPPAGPAPVELLGVESFAARAGIGRSSAWLAVSSGAVRSVKIGGRRLVPASELSRLASGGQPESEAARPAGA